MSNLYNQFIENNRISSISFSESITIPAGYEKIRMHRMHFGLITLFLIQSSKHFEDYIDSMDSTFFSLKYKSCIYFIICESDGLYLYYNSFYKADALTLIDKLTQYYELEYAESQKEKKKWLSEKRSCSIRNYYWQEMAGLKKLESEIENEYSNYHSHNIPRILLEQTQGCIDGDYVKYIPAQFEIECYIRTTFSLIEHMATLLLPLLEYKNGKEWHYLKEHAKGEFIPDSWATFILQKDNNDKFIKIFFEMVKHFDQSLADYYWSLKIDLRNVIEHGFVSGPRLDNIEYYSPSLDSDSIMSALIQDDNYFVEFDYLAYKNCQTLLQQFHDWIEKRDPVFMRILEIANFIPSDPSELLEFANGNPEKVDEFYNLIAAKIFECGEQALIDNA